MVTKQSVYSSKKRMQCSFITLNMKQAVKIQKTCEMQAYVINSFNFCFQRKGPFNLGESIEQHEEEMLLEMYSLYHYKKINHKIKFDGVRMHSSPSLLFTLHETKLDSPLKVALRIKCWKLAISTAHLMKLK